ncbi:FAD-linked oxidoreductase-like protein [Syncephalastrum racemosum]|uniref:Proline dehydrogenase n=1 Tax=Syncephalastrum racemosum TaxID=13706 RepID=A0A1X2H130_SYNRA|nr:FAD-linked oxidoreductase-like protein [Syncephalastrum racemosum]
MHRSLARAFLSPPTTSATPSVASAFRSPCLRSRPFQHVQRQAFHYQRTAPRSNTTHIKSITASIAAVTAASGYYLWSRPTALAEHHSSPATVLAELEDDNNRAAMQARSTEELILGLFVYKLCTLPWLVDAAPHLIKFAETLGLEQVAYWFVKSTFFRQFCGGETPEECVDSMEKLSRSGIHCILDLSVEADLHVDNKRGETQFEHEEKQADFTLEMIKHCLRTAARSSGALVAIKVTALAPPEVLLRLNRAITHLDQAFHEYQVNGQVDVAGLRKVVDTVLPAPANDAQRLQREALLSQSGPLDFIEFSKLFSVREANRDVWWQSNQKDGLLNTHDLAAYDRMVNRLDQICKLAYDLRAGVMVDAEQSYFQEAIDHVAMNLQTKFNKRSAADHAPTVYNTYQMYTKAAQRKLEIDVERAKRENFTFAAKLVRGAYMVSERKRAAEFGYASPIHDTLEDTHASYNGGVKFLLSKLHDHQSETGEQLTAGTAPIVFMVATHNRESVMTTIKEMERQNVLPRSGVVHFGQLFGMQDQISYALGKNGYSIYKYLPYGAVAEVIPYLLRRAQENSAVLGGVTKERELMYQEVKDRLTGKTPDIHVVSSGPDVLPVDNSNETETA